MNYNGIPIDILKRYCQEMNNNRVCFRLLQDLIVDHLYMFDVDYKLKSQISGIAKIDIKTQRYIQGSSETKRK